MILNYVYISIHNNKIKQGCSGLLSGRNKVAFIFTRPDFVVGTRELFVEK